MRFAPRQARDKCFVPRQARDLHLVEAGGVEPPSEKVLD